MYNVSVSSHSDVGDVKQSNQDSILVRTGDIAGHQVGMFIVADGCGGLAYGEEISNLIITHFLRVWDKDLKEKVTVKKFKSEAIDDLFDKTIKDINVEAVAFGEQVGRKVGSTLSLLFTIDNRFYIKNVGDSRIYLKRKNKLKQLTEDQSLVADMMRSGKMTKEDAKNSKKKNVLTMCVGVFDVIRTFCVSGKIKNGDSFLLCSDGLHNLVTEKTMCEIINDKRISHNDKCEALRNAIPNGNANDNVSSVLCSFSKKTHGIRRIIIAFLVIAVLLIVFQNNIKSLVRDVFVTTEGLCEECGQPVHDGECDVLNID